MSEIREERKCQRSWRKGTVRDQGGKEESEIRDKSKSQKLGTKESVRKARKC